MVKKNKSFVDEFMAFVKAFGVIGLALGVVIGGAAKTLVESLSANIINPILGKLGGFENLDEALVLWANEAGEGGITLGAFIGDTIEFLILLFVVYFAVKMIISRFLSKKEKEDLGI